MDLRRRAARAAGARRSAQSGVAPPTRAARRAGRRVGSPGRIRSGANATATSRPARRPRSASGSTSSSRVEPTEIVEVSTSVCPGGRARRRRRRRRAARARPARAARRPASARRRSPRRRRRSPPGSSASRRPLAAERCCAAARRRRRAGRRRPRADRLQAPLADVDPDHVGAAVVQREHGRQADVAEPDDGDARRDERGRDGGRFGYGRDGRRRGDRERMRFGHGRSSVDRYGEGGAPGRKTLEADLAPRSHHRHATERLNGVRTPVRG